jgi:AcrR family transcriptional regulator
VCDSTYPTDRSVVKYDDRMTPSAPPPDQLSARKEDVVAAAAELFRERGYDATSMQDLAAALGIRKSTLYHHVATKEDLLWLVMREPLTELVADVRAIFEDKSRGTVERIREAIAVHCTSFERHHPQMFVITRENGETLSPELQAQISELRAQYLALWKRVITAGKRSGELRSDLDAAVTVEAILGMVNWMFRWFRPGGRLSAAAVAAEFARLIEPGLLAPGR